MYLSPSKLRSLSEHPKFLPWLIEVVLQELFHYDVGMWDWKRMREKDKIKLLSQVIIDWFSVRREEWNQEVFTWRNLENGTGVRPIFPACEREREREEEVKNGHSSSPSSSVTISMWWLEGLKPMSFSARTEHKKMVAGFNPRITAKFPSSAGTESTLTFTCCPLGRTDDKNDVAWSLPPFPDPRDWLFFPPTTPPDSDGIMMTTMIQDMIQIRDQKKETIRKNSKGKKRKGEVRNRENRKKRMEESKKLGWDAGSGKVRRQDPTYYSDPWLTTWVKRESRENQMGKERQKADCLWKKIIGRKETKKGEIEAGEAGEEEEEEEEKEAGEEEEAGEEGDFDGICFTWKWTRREMSLKFVSLNCLS